MDGEVIALRETKEQEKTDEQDQVVKNAIEEFKKREGGYKKVKNSPKLVENYVAAKFKAHPPIRKERATQLYL